MEDFFKNLPGITVGKIPENLRDEIKPHPEKDSFRAEESNKGIFVFEEPGGIYWYQENNLERKNTKTILTS